MKNTITSAELNDFVNSDDFELIVQEEHARYKRIWESWAESGEVISLGSQSSWNWLTFLLPPYWFFYRKMYSALLIFFVAMFFMMLGALFFFLSRGSIFIIGLSYLGVSLVSGIYGNTWFLRRCLRIASTANERFGHPTSDAGIDDKQQHDRNVFLQETGGTNLYGFLAYMVVAVICPWSYFVMFYTGTLLLILYGMRSAKTGNIDSANLKSLIDSGEFTSIVQEEDEKTWLAWAEKHNRISLLNTISWNWRAFLAGPLWFISRKMYFEFSVAILFFAVAFISFFSKVLLITFFVGFILPIEYSAAAEYINIPSILFDSVVCWLSIGVLGAMFGNVLYLQHCLKLLKNVHTMFAESNSNSDDNNDEQSNSKGLFLEKAGGTNIFGSVLFLIGFGLLFFFLIQNIVPYNKIIWAMIAIIIVAIVYLCTKIFSKKSSAKPSDVDF